MFHKIKNVTPLPNYKLSIQFAEGVTKIYDVSQLFDKWTMFAELKNNADLFRDVAVDVGGYGIV